MRPRHAFAFAGIASLLACESILAPDIVSDAGAGGSGGGSLDAGAAGGAGGSGGGTNAGGGTGGGSSSGGGTGGGASSGGGSGGGTVDAGKSDAGNSDGGICGGAKFCEQFDTYPTGVLTQGATVGPWKVANGDVASIDAMHFGAIGKALKVHINSGASSGGQLRTKATPLFSSARPQLYGRFMMYLASGAGTSNHWTMFGAAGTVPPGSAAAGHHSTYLFSSFADGMGKNTYGAVYYDDQTKQDCWHNSPQQMPLDRWACVAFSVDGATIKYRFWLDGAAIASMSVNTTGDGCVSPTPGTTPWYGPNFDEFYIGALSFHPMTAALDVWFDDVVLDTSPVACP